MKVRIKFSKNGTMKFIGHLDIMRYFQKLIRRSNIPIAYSTGMSPHQIMSFAMPLSIGLESDAEYVDIEITERISSENAIASMNKNNVDGMNVISFKELPDDAVNAMASISAAKYIVSFRKGYKPAFNCYETLLKLLDNDEILIKKKTKKNEVITDIKPGIYEVSGDDDSITMLLSCGSVLNIKPEHIYSAIYEFYNVELSEFALVIKRLDIYTTIDNSFVSLDEIGTDINE